MTLRLQAAFIRRALCGVFLLAFTISEAAAQLSGRKLFEAPGSLPSYEYGVDEAFAVSCDFPGPFPYMASLRDELGRYRCGAVLIGEDVVLTSASCVEPTLHGSTIVSEVFLGGLDREVSIESRPVAIAIQHPDFTGDILDGADLAVVKFKGVTCLQPIPNLGRQTAPGEQYFLLGFGQTGPMQPLSGSLQIANATNFDFNTCNDVFNVTPPLDATQLCTQTPACNCGSICEGDEGGPIVLRETVLEFDDTLMGILSYSTGTCGEADTYGIHTDIQPYLNWIHRTLQSPQFLEA